jgi:hypothetical protein
MKNNSKKNIYSDINIQNIDFIFGGSFSPFCEKYLKNNILSEIPCFFYKKAQKLKSPKISTTAYNMKGCLRFSYFHIMNIEIFG